MLTSLVSLYVRTRPRPPRPPPAPPLPLLPGSDRMGSGGIRLPRAGSSGIRATAAGHRGLISLRFFRYVHTSFTFCAMAPSKGTWHEGPLHPSFDFLLLNLKILFVVWQLSAPATPSSISVDVFFSQFFRSEILGLFLVLFQNLRAFFFFISFLVCILEGER